MAKYVDADKLIKALKKTAETTGRYGDAVVAFEVCIKLMPAADVVEVKHGEWKNNKNDYPECTNCGYMPMYDHSIDDIYYSPYCPNCGAKMEEADNDA